jgi:hypothetical protein
VFPNMLIKEEFWQPKGARNILFSVEKGIST